MRLSAFSSKLQAQRGAQSQCALAVVNSTRGNNGRPIAELTWIECTKAYEHSFNLDIHWIGGSRSRSESDGGPALNRNLLLL